MTRGPVVRARVQVDRSQEDGFCKRALEAYPNEYMEVLYGLEQGIGGYLVSAFVPVAHVGAPDSLSYQVEALFEHEERAKKAGLTLLGTVHTHPDREEGIFSENDLRDVQSNQEKLMAICAVHRSKNKRSRYKTQVTYWVAPRPLRVRYLPDQLPMS